MNIQSVLARMFFSLALFGFHPAASAQVTIANGYPHLTFSDPIGLYHAGDGSDRIFVVEQAGRIRVFPNNPTVTSMKTFLNITDSTISGGELGLLGMAFHQDYATNGYFYVDYTLNNPLRSRISRFTVSSNRDSAVRTSEVVLLEQLQPYANHNGGQIAFGPDGYLYIGFGDGGSGGDPQNNGQNKNTFLGKILRINVDSSANGKKYAIPPGNPFVDSSGLKKEIYAYGFRNPWRFSFDQSTLWVGDVGQGSWEEIDTVLNGKNYGWRYREGFHLYDTSAGGYSQAILTDPLWEYGHWPNKCSITGGFVYRGSNIPQLVGKYIYGDYCSGEIFALDARLPGPPTNSVLTSIADNISSFGIDQQNELYVCAYAAGIIYKVSALPPDATILTAPSNGQTNVSGTPTLVWRTTARASSYRLQVAADSTFATTAFDDSTITDTSKQVGPLNPPARYFWRVRAKNSGGSGSYSPSWNFTTLNDTIPPATPELIFPGNLSTDQPVPLTLRWSKSAAAITYRVQLSTDSTFGTTVLDDSTLIDTTKQTGSLNRATRYYWRVRAQNTIGVSPYSTVRSFTTASYSASYHVQKGWNLVSLPVLVPDGRRSTLFPTAISHAYTYVRGSSYTIDDSLVPGLGYWLKFADSQHVVVSGTPILSDTIDISTGWNMIGTITNTAPTDSILLDPPGISNGTFFGYGSSYFQATGLQPSRGYWIKASAPGRVIITSNGTVEVIAGEQPTLQREFFIK